HHGILAKRNRRGHSDRNGQHDGEHGENADIQIADSPALDLCARGARDCQVSLRDGVSSPFPQLAATGRIAPDRRAEIFMDAGTPAAHLPAVPLTVKEDRHRTCTPFTAASIFAAAISLLASGAQCSPLGTKPNALARCRSLVNELNAALATNRLHRDCDESGQLVEVVSAYLQILRYIIRPPAALALSPI